MNSEHNRPMGVEDDIDAALKRLGETQPPAAIVSRVHHRLETAAKLQRTRSGSLFWIPVTGAVVAGVLLLAFSYGDWTTGKQGHAVKTAETARTGATAPGARETAAGRPALVSTGISRERKPAMQPVVVRRSRRERPQYRYVANLLSYPLTRQEKLLVRFAETAKPEDLQALNPEYQAKVEAQQEAEFAAYLKSGDGSSTRETTN